MNSLPHNYPPVTGIWYVPFKLQRQVLLLWITNNCFHHETAYTPKKEKQKMLKNRGTPFEFSKNQFRGTTHTETILNCKHAHSHGKPVVLGPSTFIPWSKHRCFPSICIWHTVTPVWIGFRHPAMTNFSCNANTEQMRIINMWSILLYNDVFLPSVQSHSSLW